MSNRVGQRPPPPAPATPPAPSATSNPSGDGPSDESDAWAAKVVRAPADPGALAVATRQSPAPLTAASLAAAMDVISDFFGDPRLVLSLDKLAKGGPEKLEHFSQDFANKMSQLRDQYSQLKGDPAKVGQFDQKFGELESRLADAGMNAEEFFQVATAGPTFLAARIRGADSPEEAETFSQVDALVESAADQDLKLGKSEASVRLDASAKADAPAAIQAGYDRAVSRLVGGLKQMVDAHQITDAQRQTFLDYGISRLNEVRGREMTGAFPAASSVSLGSAAWKSQMDRLLPPERTNQTLEVFADGVKYYDRMVKVIDEADSKLFVSLMKAEPDRGSLGLTDALSARVRRARGDLTSLAVINRIAAKKLEMPYEEYMDLRIHSKMEAKDIRDLRLAQEQLHRESPNAPMPDIRSPAVKARAEELKKLPDAQRKALVNQLFTHCDVKVVLDGKFADLALAGQLYGMYSLAMGHSPVAWLKGILGSMRSDVAENAVTAFGNHAQGTRYVVDALGAPLRDIEDKAAFLHHPIRFAFGAPRDLEDIGVDVKYENKVFDKKGVHPAGLWMTQHEKVFLGKRADGTLSFVTSGNNIGAKHFSYLGQDGTRHVRFHDAGVYSEGGKGSVAEDVAQYEVGQHWKDLGAAEDARSWLASSDAKVGDTSARLVTVAPQRSRSADAAVFAGLASANKRVVLINPFFTGDEFIKQAIATADRWKREGWDSSKPYDPKDPKSRQFVVILPGWLDNGISQAASFKGINAMKAHGIDVRRWNPAPGTPTPDGLGVYDRKAMMHTKVFTFESQDGADIKGFTMLGSTNLQNPVAMGLVRELGVYSEDPGVRAQVDEEVIQPDLKNSQEAKKIGAVMNVFDHAVGLATKLWQ
jgi:phosphatidylserine/phosphatidylglycerophosphate/cardiolipin synthase-like enzyme